MAQVFSAEGLTSTQKLVLLALADHANDEGLSIYPGIERLCQKTALGDRAVRKSIKELEQARIVSIVGRSRYKTNEYAIDTVELTALIPPAPRAGQDKVAAPDADGNRHHVPIRPAPRADKSSIQPSVKSSGAKTDAPSSRAERVAFDALFSELTGIPIPNPSSKKERQAESTRWYQPVRQMVALSNGASAEILRAAVAKMKAQGWQISGPRSVLKTFTALYGERKTPQAPKATAVFQ